MNTLQQTEPVQDMQKTKSYQLTRYTMKQMLTHQKLKIQSEFN